MQDYETIFEASYSRVIGPGTGLTPLGEEFFGSFYEKFLSTPSVADKFAGTDMKRQVGMLQKSFYAITSMYITRSVNDHIYKIAQTHSKAGYNVEPKLYDLWLDALIETVRERDPEFEPDVELAWRLALSAGIVLMKHYHDKPD